LLEDAKKRMEPAKYMRYGKLNNSRLEVYAAGTSDGAKDPFQEMKIEGFVPGVKAIMQVRTSCGLLFPGQGSQYVKMMSSIIDLPSVKKMLAEATSILGFDIGELVLQGPETELEKTSKCQPAMFLAGMAGLEKLKQERPDAVEKPGAVAGLSLGEYTALCCAGVFTFEQGMKLVKVRGEAMEAAATSGSPQAMLSVAGLEQDEIEKLCKEAAGSNEVCGIANILFPKGFSCSGSLKAINALKDKAEKAGAMQAKLLKTSGAFHTELMKPAQVKLDKALKELLPDMKPPTCDIYMNYTGKKIKAGTPPKNFIDNLSAQLCSPVLWEPSVRLMIKDGLTEFYEVGPMKQLKAMMKRIDATMWSSTMNVEV
jgi:[acyl-carrier-protein] S-malonyltransferase